jgi:hypothetical protein
MIIREYLIIKSSYVKKEFGSAAFYVINNQIYLFLSSNKLK